MTTPLQEWQALIASTPINSKGIGEPGGDGLLDLSTHLGHIRVSGSDGMTLLQGQFTGDMREIGADGSGLYGICNPKGRLLALARIGFCGHHYHLLLPAELGASIAQRLGMFVLRSDARVQDKSEETVIIGVSGEQAAARLAALGLTLPGEINGMHHDEGLHVLRIPGGTSRLLVFGEPDRLRPLWQELAGAFPILDQNSWETADVLAAIPEVYPDTSTAFVPQMVNLQALQGISFTKGCYSGQEIVARMQYLGTLKRRMYLAAVDSPEAPVPSVPLYGDDPSDTQSVGQVVRAVHSSGNGYRLLVVLKITAAEDGGIHLGAADGPKLEFQELPYPLQLET